MNTTTKTEKILNNKTDPLFHALKNAGNQRPGN